MLHRALIGITLFFTPLFCVATTHVLTASPASVNFGSQTVSTNVAQALTITNTGTGSVQVQNVTISGPTAFQVSGFTSTTMLRPSQSLALSVSFTPAAQGAYSGSVVITATGGASTSVPMSGSGTGGTSQVSVTIDPTSATVQTGQSQPFTATVTGTTNTSVTWLVNGVAGGNATVGTISSGGLYTAPATAPSSGSVTVTTQSVADPSKSASATVTIGSGPLPVLITVTVSPTTATVQVNLTQQFTATVTGTANTNVNWLVNGVVGGNSTVGTISTSGLYTAPATVPSSPSVTVTAQSVADTTRSANATVTITAATTTYSNLDASTTLDAGGGMYGWGWCGTPSCAGGGTTATQNIYWGQQPSLDSGSIEFLVSGSAWADALWWYKIGPNNSATNFQFDFWLNVSQEATTYSQALEFDMFQYVSPTRYMFGTECNYSKGYNNGTWDVWNTSGGLWYHTSLACPGFVPGDWYHITWNFNRTADGSEHYNNVTVQHYDSTGTTQLDSSNTAVNIVLPSGPLPSGWTSNLGVQFQSDINDVPGSSGTATYAIWVDKVTLTVW